jgi:small subunit ribosomal protein S2
MVDELIKKLLEAGVHFGHQTKRWDPKMRRFIFGKRSGIYIIDLEKTVEYLNLARDFAKDIAAKGGQILFVGTKKQAQSIIEKEAKNCGMVYVKNRWSGGLLTNFQTVKGSLARLKEIEDMGPKGIWENLKKKETSRLTKEKEKLLFNFGGIREMRDMPQAVFVVDTKKEIIAVREARKLNIPIVAIVDTNSNPDEIDYPIPGNDDAVKSINIITSLLAQSINEGRKEYLTGKSVKEKIEVEETVEETAS